MGRLRPRTTYDVSSVMYTCATGLLRLLWESLKSGQKSAMGVALNSYMNKFLEAKQTIYTFFFLKAHFHVYN